MQTYTQYYDHVIFICHSLKTQSTLKIITIFKPRKTHIVCSDHLMSCVYDMTLCALLQTNIDVEKHHECRSLSERENHEFFALSMHVYMYLYVSLSCILCTQPGLVGDPPTNPSENRSLSVEIMKFPTEWQQHETDYCSQIFPIYGNNIFQTTNQLQ